MSDDLRARVAAVLPACATFVAPSACTDPASGRDKTSPYGATGYCVPCQIRDVLDSHTPEPDEEARCQAREREVMASVAAELLDVVHAMGAALATKPGPYGMAGQAALNYEKGVRIRFGTDSTTRQTVGYHLVCDQPQCHVSTQATTIEQSRAVAASLGWAVGIRARGRLTDLCPAHAGHEPSER